MSASLLDPPQNHTGAAPDTDTAPDEELLTAVGALGDHLGATMHALQRARAHMSTGEGASEWSSRVVLAKIVMTGPKRVSELAELAHVDTSTVSRQVAAMVRDGLLERQADPDDGRASLLVATDRGRAAMAEFRVIRNRELARVLGSWSTADLQTFADSLARFAGDLTAATAAATGPAAGTTITTASGPATAGPVSRTEGDQTS